jgi:hypothetical protein
VPSPWSTERFNDQFSTPRSACNIRKIGGQNDVSDFAVIHPDDNNPPAPISKRPFPKATKRLIVHWARKVFAQQNNEVVAIDL